MGKLGNHVNGACRTDGETELAGSTAAGSTFPEAFSLVSVHKKQDDAHVGPCRLSCVSLPPTAAAHPLICLDIQGWSRPAHPVLRQPRSGRYCLIWELEIGVDRLYGGAIMPSFSSKAIWACWPRSRRHESRPCPGSLLSPLSTPFTLCLYWLMWPNDLESCIRLPEETQY